MRDTCTSTIYICAFERWSFIPRITARIIFLLKNGLNLNSPGLLEINSWKLTNLALEIFLLFSVAITAVFCWCTCKKLSNSETNREERGRRLPRTTQQRRESQPNPHQRYNEAYEGDEDELDLHFQANPLYGRRHSPYVVDYELGRLPRTKFVDTSSF